MKKMLLMLLCFCCVSVFAAEAEEESWSFFEPAFTPEIPYDAANTKICGVKAGLPCSGGVKPVYGVEGSVVYAGTENVTGLQCSLITAKAVKVSGLQLSLLNFSVKVAGVQLGIVNIADDSAFQIGIVNIIKNSPLTFFPVINFRF